MNGKFRHSMKKHGGCFNCVATSTQLSMDHGGVGLFPVLCTTILLMIPMKKPDTFGDNHTYYSILNRLETLFIIILQN